MSSDAPKKIDEPAVVQAIAGPYAGQRLTMSKADADAAVADKWAVDPSAPPPKEGEAKEAKPLTDDERAEIKAKAEKAARKLRGEPEPEESAKPAVEAQPHRETATRDLGADKPSSGYPTRDLGRK
jgi:hypothetical protein